ncbi:glycoside hydrolase family 38 C-terminal domain-containing protein [Schumannella luteola]|uniref:Alpha-mannosidase n=1 Tax=Schumannella luteola TaxID=472059 RepID=A0A852YHA3_9MICO|nr:glycoside hydrolase family 38 C-terminal domain-containing protein [Schumannella luteola]NYH00532.1 alpha-mannosidase [Schumannella luteola]TPX03114.1 alpha-mannosidase [Schumannella luteola]
MHDTAALIEARIRRSYRERILPAAYSATAPVEVTAWEAPGEPVPFAEAVGQTFEPFEMGRMWGRPWGTTWLRVTGTVPADWPADAIELVADLGFLPSGPGFQSEGLIWSEDGVVVKGLEPKNTFVPVPAGPGESFTLYIEAASNPDVGSDWSNTPTPLGDLATAPRDPIYRFTGAHLGVFDREAFALERDVWTLLGVLENLPVDSTRRAGLLRALERAIDVLDPDDVSATAAAARAEIAGVLADRAAGSTHRTVAVGHAHIDSAWLWPVRETRRKVARTFSNVLDLMDRYPDFVFAASSAQQYAWMKEGYPELFERIRARVKEGRFVPVGGMWVESDTNMPGGEAMARQFVFGKGFFLREFGVETKEVWLPDSFGYSAGLPQIVAASASDNFLTQKISWNETNVMPHHTFLWEGLDGTRIFTHFPPVDTYNSDLSGTDLARAESQNRERGVSDLSLVPYGYGDGGGGPTREMIETAHRKHDLDGSAKVDLKRPDEFFAEARASLPKPAVWSGELYLEFHRGTYTSQSRTKEGNRRSEHLLREAELWAATAAVRAGAAYPADALRQAWETVLLQQFHDILPGSSIAWVHQDAERNYAAVAESLEGLIGDALGTLSGGAEASTGAGEPVAFNASPVEVDGIPALSAGVVRRASTRVTATDDGGAELASDSLTARLDREGHLVSLVRRDGAAGAGREAIAPGGRGNELQFFRDTPNQWDAWDIDAAYQRIPIDAVSTESLTIEGDTVVLHRTVGESSIVQRLALSGDGRGLEIETEIDWHERQKLLKLAFSFDVHAATAASEVQFGHVRRATHANTSWDMARFETSAHRWVHVDEPGFGVTVANDRVYGHDVTRTTRDDGGTTTLVRESLLRAPTFPDPHADQGRHVFHHVIVPGELLDGIGAGYRVNLPLRTVAGGAGSADGAEAAGAALAAEPLVKVTGPASASILIDAVKLAEDGSGDVVVRLYEARGGRAAGRLEPGFAAGAAVRTDLLERALEGAAATDGGRGATSDDALELNLRPFELVTVRIPRA